MKGDWFASDTDEGGESSQVRLQRHEEVEVVDYGFGHSDSESESKTERLKELLRDDSSKDLNLGSSRGGGLPNVDLGVYSSRSPAKAGEVKGRPRVGRRAAGRVTRSEPVEQDHLKQEQQEKQVAQQEKQVVRAKKGSPAGVGAGFVTNSLYVSPNKDNNMPSPKQERSASSVTGEWSLDMDQMLPDNNMPKPKVGRRQGQKEQAEGEAEATSKAVTFEKRSPKQEKLPSLKPSSPKMTMSAGYQPSFMTRAIEIEDSRSGIEVSESIGFEYSEDFESSRSSLSPARVPDTSDDAMSRRTKLPNTDVAESRRQEPSAPSEEVKTLQKKYPSLSPKGKGKTATSPPEATSVVTPKKTKKKASPSKAKKTSQAADKTDASSSESRLASLKTKLEAMKSQSNEYQKEKEAAMKTNLQAKAQNRTLEKEVEDLKASLATAQEENKKLKSAYEQKSQVEKDSILHAQELEEKVISLNEELREKDDIAKSITSFDGIQSARMLLTVKDERPDTFDDFHPVINEFLEEIRSTLTDERSNLRKEQERIDKLMSSVNLDKQSNSKQISVIQDRQKEVEKMQLALREEKLKMETEIASERGKIRDQIESERKTLRKQIQSERDKFTDEINSGRKKMEYDKESLQRSIRQLKSEEELLKVKIQRLDDEFNVQRQKVDEQTEVVEQLRASVQTEKQELERSKQEHAADKTKVDKDLAHIQRLKEDVERQIRSVTEDKILVNSERQILTKLSSEINDKEAQLARKKEELRATKESVEKNMEKLATERVELAYQLKLLTDERLKSSAAAKEAREAEVQLRARMMKQPGQRKTRSRGTQQWVRVNTSDAGDRGLSYGLRMQLLMAELERERQTISHDKKRNALLLEAQEKFVYEAKTELMRAHTVSDKGVWAVKTEALKTPRQEMDQSSESRLDANASFTAFTDLTQLTTDDE